MKPFSDQKIIDSWRKNAFPWITALENEEIASRVNVTNQAIINAVLIESPKKVLDIGCGEGWLIRRLQDHGIVGIGIDIVPELIEYARRKEKGQFLILAYEDLSFASIGQTFEVIVCNFSLLGKESVEHIFQQAYQLLDEGGAFIIQTVHPEVANGMNEYKDGWRTGSWAGFSKEFVDPAPWYFRTIDSWKRLFLDNGFLISKIIEPFNPRTNDRTSLILKAIKK